MTFMLSPRSRLLHLPELFFLRSTIALHRVAYLEILFGPSRMTQDVNVSVSQNILVEVFGTGWFDEQLPKMCSPSKLDCRDSSQQ